MTEMVQTITINSQMTDDTREIRYVDRDQDRFRKNESTHGGEPCQICGRKVGNRDLYVGTIDGSEAVHAADAAWLDANSLDYMGYYRVGSECAKNLPAGFVTGNPFNREVG